jgi:DNA-binding transcriptional ArsR family regulator
MDKQLATTIFESLASGVRLDVFRLLVKNAPDGLVAGEIAVQLVLPPTNLSFHLKAMTHSGLINVVQEGRYQRYRANLPVIRALITYLTDECCTGHPEHCFEDDSVSACCGNEANLSPTARIDS